jgi:pimeloyl-ACP methyl ester carboxylesterase
MTPDALVLVPGIMGSELYDRDNRLVWGLKPSLLFQGRRLRTVIDRLAVTEESDGGIRPGGPVHFPGWLPILDGVEPYERMLTSLRAFALRPSAVLAFGYDWRLSIDRNAEQLRDAVAAHLAAWRDVVAGLDPAERGREEPRVTFVCHSMGGLVARWFATFLDEQQVTRRVITLGTPFSGAVKSVRLLAVGDVMRFGLLAAPLRDAARTMPGVHDLLPTYRAWERSGGTGRPDVVEPAVDDFVAIGAARTLVAGALARRERVTKAPAGDVEIRSLVGVRQPTLSSWSGAGTQARFLDTIEGDRFGGDGTVFAASAFLPGQTPGGYLPQKHGRLAGTDEAIAFVQAVLAEDELRRFQAVDGPGLVVPPSATVHEPLEFEVTSWDGASTIVIEDAESGREVDRLSPVRRDDRRVASTTLHREGLYRVRLIAGGFSDISELLGVTGTGE